MLGVRPLVCPVLVGRDDLLDLADRRIAEVTADGGRFLEIARCVAEGMTNVEIAEELGITPRTAASHVEHILAKLGVGRRAEIAVWAASRPVLHSRPSRR